MVIRFLFASLVAVILGVGTAQSIEDLAESVARSLGGQEEFCDDVGLDVSFVYNYCVLAPRSAVFQLHIENAIRAEGGAPVGGWKPSQVGSLWVDQILAVMPDYDVYVMSIVPYGSDIHVVWFSTEYDGGLDGLPPEALIPAPPPIPRYESPVTVAYEVADVEGPHTVMRVDSPTRLTVQGSGLPQSVTIGSIVLESGVDDAEGRRAVSALLFGQVVYLVEGSNGHLVYFRNADGAWNLGGYRAELANARLVHEGPFEMALEEDAYGDLTQTVRHALTIDPMANYD